MKLEHIGLTVTDPAEVENFYHDILGMSEVRNFVLEKDLAGRIFGIDKEISVFLLQNEKLLLEIFLLPEQKKQNFDHICISIKNREELIEKAAQNGYEYIRLNRKYADLMFIKDKSGNTFEIKESNTNKNKT
jgi:catechol 2,3-dioxygenase-like lactoylglutathione lyase family enzyme